MKLQSRFLLPRVDLLLFILIIIEIVACIPYPRLGYEEIIQELESLAKLNSKYIRIHEINLKTISNFTQPDCSAASSSKASSTTPCRFVYAEITLFSGSSEQEISSRPQVFFSGGMQGNNALGPNIVMHLATYLVENSQHSNIARLLNDRVFILYPIPNPRDFMIYSFNGNDLSMHFPTEQLLPSSSSCFQSYEAAALNYIFSTHLIVTGAIFELNGVSIEYNLQGDQEEQRLNITSQPQKLIAEHLIQYAPTNTLLFTAEYQVQEMNHNDPSARFYNWVNYASANFYNQTNNNSINNTCLSQSNISAYSHASNIYRVRCSKIDPSNQYYGEKEQSTNPYSSRVGHIQRNILLGVELAELAAPLISAEIKLLDKHRVYAEWKITGCLQVDKSAVFYQNISETVNKLNASKISTGSTNNKNSNNLENNQNLDNNVDVQYDYSYSYPSSKSEISSADLQSNFKLSMELFNQSGSLVNYDHKLHASFQFDNPTVLDLVILAKCDSDWNDSGRISQEGEEGNTSESSENNQSYSKQTQLMFQLRNQPGLIDLKNSPYSLTSRQELQIRMQNIHTVNTIISQSNKITHLHDAKESLSHFQIITMLHSFQKSSQMCFQFVFVAAFPKIEQRISKMKDQAHKENFEFWVGILIALGAFTFIIASTYLGYKCVQKYKQFAKTKLLQPKAIDPGRPNFSYIAQHDVDQEEIVRKKQEKKKIQPQNNLRNNQKPRHPLEIEEMDDLPSKISTPR